MSLTKLQSFVIILEAAVLGYLVSLINIESSIPWIKSTRNSTQRLSFIITSFLLYLFYKYAKERKIGSLRVQGTILLLSTALFNTSFLISISDCVFIRPGRFWFTSKIYVNFSSVLSIVVAVALSSYILFYDGLIIPSSVYTETSGIFFYLEERIHSTIKRSREIAIITLSATVLFALIYKLILQYIVIMAGSIARIAIPMPSAVELLVYVVISVVSVLFNYFFISLLDAIFIYNASVLKIKRLDAKSKIMTDKSKSTAERNYYINQLLLFYKKNNSVFLRKHPEIISDLFLYFNREFSKFGDLVAEICSKCQTYSSNKYSGLFGNNKVVYKNNVKIETLTLWECVKLRYEIFILYRRYSYCYFNVVKMLNFMVIMKDRENMETILNKYGEEVRDILRKIAHSNGFKIVNMEYKRAADLVGKLILS